MKQTAAKLASYTLIGAGVTIWCNMANKFSYNADQVVGLTICFTLVGVIFHQIVLEFKARKPRPAPIVDVLTFFDEA